MKLVKSFFTFLLLFFLCSNFLYSQDYALVDSKVGSYPENSIDADQLAQMITTDFSKPNDRARAIYTWVATNIKYDIALGENIDAKPIMAFSYKTEKEKEVKEKKFKLELVKNTMTTKMAVCHGYAALIEYLYLKVGLEAKTIIGTIKTDPSQIGEMPAQANHAWNAVKLDGVWRFVDGTLGAGYISENTNAFKFYFNDSYYCTEPERFFLNHFPLDQKWLLVSKTKTDFSQLPLFFGPYFENNYEVIKPESGIYSSEKNENFVFSIKGLSEYDSIAYSFNTENQIIDLEQDDNFKDFSIPLIGKKNDYVSIFINRKLIAIYKII